jgi:hypothetical protein
MFPRLEWLPHSCHSNLPLQFGMNATLDPREVDKPFVQRWLRAALALLIRSPFRFGILIAVLGCLDTSAMNLANGYVIERVWVDRLGMITLPLLWVFVSAIVRGADDGGRTWEALSNLRRRSVWMGALSVGVGMVALSWFVYSLFSGFGALATRNPHPYLQHQGDLLSSIEAGVMLIVSAGGLTYCPLLALVPEISASHARSLSKKAERINGLITIVTMTGILVIGAIYLTSALPAYGMTTAAFLVFFGVLNYVAYRDMFERRDENLPKQVMALQISGAVELGHAEATDSAGLL